MALLANTNRLGGIIIEGLGGTDIDNHGGFQNSSAVGGLALTFYKRNAATYGWLAELEDAIRNDKKKPELWRYEPSTAERVIKEWVAEFDIDVFYSALLDESENSVEKTSGRIQSIRMEDGRVFSGQVFIDATVEGDLLAASGISTVIGRESNEAYGEERNGIIPIDLSQPIRTNMDPFIVPGDSTSGLLYTISDEKWGAEGDGDHRLQAYCLRVCLTDSVKNQAPFSRPANYDRDKYQAYLRH